MNRKHTSIIVLENEITVTPDNYISLTDMLKAKDGDFFISDWLRNRNTLEYLGIWEQVHNPAFNYGEFATIKSQAGLNNYKISVKEWVQKTNAIGLTAKAGRYGGTYAHADIAFEFGMWISAEFKIDYANVSQLVCLANLENLNAVLIDEKTPQTERLKKLNQIAIHQMKILVSNGSTEKLGTHE